MTKKQVLTGDRRWSRVLLTIGLVATLIGVIDPLEGSLVILLGTATLALGARLGNSRHRMLLYWSFMLVAIGVSAMWGLSAMGGVGGRSGRSIAWALVMLPYPVGWIAGLVGAIRMLREGSSVQLTPRNQSAQ